MPLPAVAVGIAKVGAIIGKGAMAAGRGLAAGAKAGVKAGAKIGSSAVKTGSRATSSSVKGAKNLKISVTNIRSVLNKKTKRLGNLQKINKRIKNNILKSELKIQKENKLESQNKKKKIKMPGPIKGAIAKIGQVGGLLLAGIGINALFGMLDKTKTEADDLSSKVDSMWGSTAKDRSSLENKLNKIDTKKLIEDGKEFGNMMEREKSNVPETVKDPNSSISVTDSKGNTKKLSGREFLFSTMKDNEEKRLNSSDGTGSGDDTSSTNNNGITPLKTDKNLSSVLNNGDDKQTVILTRQVVEVPV